jgi:hypothetical protein
VNPGHCPKAVNFDTTYGELCQQCLAGSGFKA